jgi:hypothetical protein
MGVPKFSPLAAIFSDSRLTHVVDEIRAVLVRNVTEEGREGGREG